MENKDNLKELRITYEQWGKEFANKTNSNPENLNFGLDSVYGDFLKKQNLDKEAIKEKIKNLEIEISDLEKKTLEQKAHTEKLNTDNQFLLQKIEADEKEILIKENKILEIEKGDIRKGDSTKLNIYLAFAIIAGVGTLLSYTATFGSALLGLDDGDNFIRGNVYSDLFDLGTGNLVFAIFVALAPIICGFIYGYYNSINKIAPALGALLIIVLIDIFVGYKLTETIYNQLYMNGIHDEEWKTTMVFYDINFYIVIVFNFALYYAFGWMLNSYLKEKEKLTPDYVISKSIEQVENEINKLKEKVSNSKEDMNNNLNKLSDLEAEIKNNTLSIDKKNISINDYRDGKMPINLDLLKELIADYIGGYLAYTTLMYEPQSKDITAKVRDCVERWWKIKETNGWKTTTEESFWINIEKK
ncbi:coiled-coil domain-containing protein [Bergeyella sp. RCAD1439]|uniref:coiled-coil domain-containing protein n=1 Tax=Bergeyella anatis TaxID=3113737 RepID=UPI002E171924|nr:hypothetical protein [Bergeyella sp. RCAD1439]